MSFKNPRPEVIMIRRMFHEFAEAVDPLLEEQGLAFGAEAFEGGGTGYARFFEDMDSYTEYWDIYRPELQGRYMAHVGTLFGDSLRKWFAFVLKENTPEGPALYDRLLRSVNSPATVAALNEIDSLLQTLLTSHFSAATASGVDSSEYLNAIELFAVDGLPPNPDRLARTPPSDGRHPFAGRHRMDGASMWFSWAGVLDCDALADGLGGTTPVRTLQIAGAAFGSAMDFTFRGVAGFRGNTRPEYRPDETTRNYLRLRVRELAGDADAAQREARELYRIFKG
jgi:hypothetical protein